MPKCCCICGKTMGFMEQTYSYDDYHNMCEQCATHHKNINTSYWRWKTDDQIDESFKYISLNAKSTFGDKKICADLIDKINQYKCGYESFLELQKAGADSFPEQESKKIDYHFAINSNTKKFAVLLQGKYQYIHDFRDLLDFEVKEDGVSTLSGRAGAAAIGAVLAGPTGAVIGQSMSRQMKKEVSQLDIIITFKQISMPPETMHLLTNSLQTDSDLYKKCVNTCNEIISLLKQIINDNKREEDNESDSIERKARAIYAFSVADEIRKFKDLLDEGIITPDEFEIQKKKLLSLDY